MILFRLEYIDNGFYDGATGMGDNLVPRFTIHSFICKRWMNPVSVRAGQIMIKVEERGLGL